MKNRIFRKTALIFAALLLIVQFCACSCIEKDVEHGEEPSAKPTEYSADASQQPEGSEGADTTVPPDVVPTEGQYVTPAPDTTPAGPDTPDETVSPINITPEPTLAPGTTPTAPVTTPVVTLPPDATPTPVPDTHTDLTWFDDSAPVLFDLDFDGVADKVELKLTKLTDYAYSCMLKVTVGATGKEVVDAFTTEYFTKALINNFNSGDNRAEIVVCTGTGNRGQITKAYRLNAYSNAFVTTSISGWVESVSDNTMLFGRYADIMGTWACSATFGFSNAAFAFEQISEKWQVHRDSDRWCTVADEILVQLYIASSTENYAGFLDRGCKIYPTATDLSTFIEFTSDLGESGAITISKGTNGTFYISGRPIDDWFSDLTYID